MEKKLLFGIFLFVSWSAYSMEDAGSPTLEEMKYMAMTKHMLQIIENKHTLPKDHVREEAIATAFDTPRTKTINLHKAAATLSLYRAMCKHVACSDVIVQQAH